ncbi:hypothetical protein JCM9279_004852 [Rhodotorula babjevae]
MCIVFFTSTAQYSLIIASNRDEFLARPTTPAAWHHWDPTHLAHQPSPTHPVLSGLDLSAGGTWLGLSFYQPHPGSTTADGTIRFATLTNFTESIPPAPRPSRGNLTRDFLDLDCARSSGSRPQDGGSLDAYLEQVEATKSAYAGFNLLVGELSFPSAAPAPLLSSSSSSPASASPDPTVRLGYISNRETPTKRARVLPPLGTAGHVRGLSNATLEVEEGEVEWPKVKSGAAAVEGVATRVEDERRSEGLRDDEVEERLARGLYDALSTAHVSPIEHRAHLRHTVLVRPLYFDPSAPMPDDAPPFPPPSSSAPSTSALPPSAPSSPSHSAPSLGPPEAPTPDPTAAGAHWYATRVQSLVLVERRTGRVVVRERDAFVLDEATRRPVWSGEERVFEVRRVTGGAGARERSG